MKRLFISFVSLIFLNPSFVHASFEENAHRYLSGQEIIWSLAQYFDFSKNATNAEICTKIESVNATLSGSNSSVTGEPISPSPTQATVLWITGCVESYFSTSTIVAADNQRLRNLVGDEMMTYLGKDLAKGLDSAWADVPVDIQKTMIAHIVSSFLGPDDVIKDFGFITDPDDYRSRLLTVVNAQQNASVLRITALLSLNLSVRDEFLSY